MEKLELCDLYNPDNIAGIHTKKGVFVITDDGNQGFQETLGRWQLWQKFDDGRLLCIKQWNKSAVLAAYEA